jgi:hypothetical protein
MPEATKHDRRRFLRNAAMTIAVAEFGMSGSADAQSNKQPSGLKGEHKMSQLNQAQSISDAQGVGPFRANMPDAALADLRRRLAATGTVNDAGQSGDDRGPTRNGHHDLWRENLAVTTWRRSRHLS